MNKQALFSLLDETLYEQKYWSIEDYIREIKNSVNEIEEEQIIYTGEELLFQFWVDYREFSDGDTTFENWAPEVMNIDFNGDKKYKTNAQLSYFEEVSHD